MFMNYDMKIVTIDCYDDKNTELFIMNNLKVTFRIYFAGNLYLTIKYISYIQNIMFK